MENTGKKKRITKKQFIKRIFKVIFFGYVIVMIAMFLINGLLEDKRTIYEKIGTLEPYSISIKDALNIKAYGLETYIDYIKNEDFKSAYDMLSKEYKDFVSYKDYLETLKGINFETFGMKEIKMKTENTYVATVVYERNEIQEETTYLLYLNKVNPKIITISPNKFIYGYHDSKYNMDNIELKVEECIVYTDSIEMTGKVKNTSLFETLKINNIGLGYDESINKNENVDITIAPGEEKEINVNYDTNYYIPNNIKLKSVKNEDTLRTYTFYFKEAK